MDSDEEKNPLEGFWMEGDSLAPPCQADMDVIEVILKLGNLTEKSVLYDLGCGDGRICIEATKRYGAKSRGVEIEVDLIQKFENEIVRLGLQEKSTAIHGDLLDIDLSDATVVVLYLLPEAVELIRLKLEAVVRNGKIVICNSWGPKGWNPVICETCGPYNNVAVKVYDYTSLPDGIHK
jgi:SAM-dependent methyltransferase